MSYSAYSLILAAFTIVFALFLMWMGKTPLAVYYQHLLHEWAATLDLRRRPSAPDVDPALVRFLEETTRHGNYGLAYEVFHHPVNECSAQEHVHSFDLSTHPPHLAKRAFCHLRSPRYIRNVRSRSVVPAFPKLNSRVCCDLMLTYYSCSTQQFAWKTLV
ncbi:unnamed protein product [Taenia asiatica]|uniref:Secreted protein n=1 Tax=Taenia asiatica TaxID=60517 RepID=A0A0R3W9T1_TAEAS|nr:unnamed protein product [Taenia asiatica]